MASVIDLRECSGTGTPEKFLSKTSRLAEQQKLLVCNQAGKKTTFNLWYCDFVRGKLLQFWQSRISAAQFIASTGSRCWVWTPVKFVTRSLVCVCDLRVCFYVKTAPCLSCWRCIWSEIFSKNSARALIISYTVTQHKNRIHRLNSDECQQIKQWRQIIFR